MPKTDKRIQFDENAVESGFFPARYPFQNRMPKRGWERRKRDAVVENELSIRPARGFFGVLCQFQAEHVG